MKNITFIFLFLGTIGFAQNLGNPATIGQSNRNQKVGKGLQITDSLITDGVVVFKNLVTYGSGVDTGVGFKNGKIVRFLNTAGGGGGDNFITKTKTQIDALISTNALVKGATYKITGVHSTLYDDGTTSGTTIILKAISENVLETQGTGIFYNPKYNKSVDGFGIWDNKMYGTFSTIVGTFDYQNKETVTSNNGATGILLADGMIQYVSGNWSSATSITGDTSSATANVADFVSPSYAVNDKVIWGGYSWTNNTGAVGSSVDVLNLDGTNWSKNVYDTTNYNLAYDLIEYDYANDMIIRRHDLISNIDVRFDKGAAGFFTNFYSIPFNAISVQQFGNPFNLVVGKGVFNKSINNAYDESINFSGSNQYNLTFGESSNQYNLTFGASSYQTNLTFEQGSSQTNLTFGQNSYQNNLTFGESSNQYNLTFGASSYQTNLTFGQNSQVDFNNQTLNSNMGFIDFKTKSFTAPNLSSATYIFDGKIKEVYQRPDETIKLKFMNNSDVLEVHGIAD